MRTCKKHNVSGIATYGDCPQCIKEQGQHGDLKHSPEYLTKLLEECEDELELKTIALANARKWESLSATEVCAGNPAIAEYVASLESRLAKAERALKHIFDATDPYADGAPDSTDHDKLCNEVSSLARPWARTHSENDQTVPTSRA